MIAIREARGTELATWDDRAVRAPGGHVYQSRAWGEFQGRSGWRTRYLQFDDGFPVLVLQRRWPWVGGWSAYVSRGPIPSGTPEATAERQLALARWLGARGVDVVAADPEVEAATAYPALIRAGGFRPIEELQPSRHRMRIPLAGRDEGTIYEAIARSTRQRIRRAETGGVGIAEESTDAAFGAFYDLLRATGDRRGFTFGSRAEFAGWWPLASRAGHLVLLTARTAGDAPMLAGLMLLRHGGRLSTVHSADLASARAEHPGVLHLLRWRALQLAIAEGCTEMDLGGVDVAGARRVPEPGDATFGLYEHKRSFGAEWVELAGAHEFVARPLRYAGGRIAQRLQHELTRRVPLARGARGEAGAAGPERG